MVTPSWLVAPPMVTLTGTGPMTIRPMHAADVELAVRAILFAAVGTAGQRCPPTRRLLLEKGVVDEAQDRLSGGNRLRTNARLAIVDFSGFYIKVGIKIKF